MVAQEAIYQILKESGVKVSSLAAMLDKNQSVISSRLNQADIGFLRAIEMLRALDYKVVFMPRSVPTPRGALVVDDKPLDEQRHAEVKEKQTARVQRYKEKLKAREEGGEDCE